MAVQKIVPPSLGPYRQRVDCGDLVFVSGQIGIDPSTGEFSGSDAASQARQALVNLGAILGEGNLGFGSVVKTTIFLIDMRDFVSVNAAYAEFFKENFPARSTVAVSALPKGAIVEIEAIARKEG